nr:unnamed protein product [Callosobruchus chinensis]
MRFRLKKTTVLHVLSLIDDDIETVSDRNHSISLITQLLFTLRYYATGAFLMAIGDTFVASKGSGSKIVKKVSLAIARLSPRFIKMPQNEEEILEEKHAFYERAGLPKIIGSIDCTHVKIQSPVTRTRNPVERQYGVWKRKFPVLAVGIRVQLATTLNIIVATAVLHNIAIDHNEDGPIDDPEISSVNFNEEIVVGAPVGPNHTNARDFLLTEYIPHLLH